MRGKADVTTNAKNVAYLKAVRSKAAEVNHRGDKSGSPYMSDEPEPVECL
jgi:hypothetical protein